MIQSRTADPSIAFAYRKTARVAQAVTLTDTGNATLTILGIDLTGSSQASFEELNTCALTLASNAG